MDQSGRDRQPSLLSLIRKKLDKGWQNGYNTLVSSSKIASVFAFGRKPSVGNGVPLKLLLGFRRK